MTRFVPARAGIMALYEYDDVVFELAGGRLLLRGHNTSGKTKALELLLPFCLDGDISPRKLDPFARSAKEMKWNLVGCVDNEQRIGYVWLEFERLGEAGVERLTCGVGMKASRGRERVTRWYFLIRDRRVGEEISLRRGDSPLTRSQLADLLEDGDELLGGPGEYRSALNRALYGFPSVEQYETMIGLLLELRRPHLSKSLDPSEVTRLLSASLPEVDHELMRRLGEGIEQLDQLQAALERLERLRELLDGFIASAYAPYARALTSDRGDRLRSANTAFDRASAERRRRAEERGALAAAAEATVARLGEAKRALDAAGGEHAALLASREWASIAEVEQLGRTAGHAAVAAERAREHLESAAAALAVAEADAIAAAAASEQALAARDAALDELAAEAGAAGLERRHAVLAAALTDDGRDPRAGAALLREEAAGWLELLAAHRKLRDALASATERAERAREEQEDAAARLRSAAESAAAATLELDAARECLAGEIATWADGLRELASAPEALERASALALEAGSDGASAPADALRAGADAQRDELVEKRSLVLAERRALVEERAVLERRLAGLRAERDEPPARVASRPAERGERPGAPLWLLVDFRDELGAGERRGIEAALEGAGLLDAWVTPDGRALDPGTLDAALVADADRPAAEGRTLSDVLHPLSDRPVPVSVLERLLGTVALCERAPTPAQAPAVSSSGHYALGPLSGRFEKPHAEYIGAAARAERRARTIAVLETELAAHAERDGGLGREVAALEGRLAALAAELAAFPDVARVASARRAQDTLARREREARRELGERERAAADAANRRAAEAERCSEHAATHGLPAAIDEPGLRSLEQATHRYRASAGGAATAVERAREAGAWQAQLEARLGEGRTEADELRRAAEAGAADARRLKAEHAEREAALGRSGDEIRERMRAVETRLRDLREEVERLHEEDKRGATRLQAAEDVLGEAEAALAQTTAARDGALAEFRRLGPAGVLALALGDHSPPDLDEAPGWSLTRALELLRAVPEETLRVRSSLLRLSNSVQERAGELDRALGQQAELSVITEQTQDGVVLVKVREGGAERSVSELAARLETEIADRERTLTAEQRRVFGDALLEEIAEHLRGRVDRVEALVADMNATLDSCPTGSGKTVQLEWRPREDDAGELRRVMRLLRRSVATLGEHDRAALVGFFRARIDHAREEAAVAVESGAGAAAHLLDAFDYRDWHEFGIFECRDGRRERLTRRRHALGSGGEQAVLIHMPLFAAAAALYSSSVDGRAPRLVMLDEALSGIDDETRAKVMGVLVKLDLDFVMTSHELWGTYRSVPQLSIYQLHRDNGVFGVASERFLWDGDLLHELAQGSLLQ